MELISIVSAIITSAIAISAAIIISTIVKAILNWLVESKNRKQEKRNLRYRALQELKSLELFKTDPTMFYNTFYSEEDHFRGYYSSTLAAVRQVILCFKKSTKTYKIYYEIYNYLENNKVESSKLTDELVNKLASFYEEARKLDVL